MSYFWKMSQRNMTFDLKINLGHSDLYFTIQRFLVLFFALKNILVLFTKPDSGKLRCPATALNCIVSSRFSFSVYYRPTCHIRHLTLMTSCVYRHVLLVPARFLITLMLIYLCITTPVIPDLRHCFGVPAG